MSKQALIEVMDDGDGIAIKYQAQIFEPFFTKRAGGVGLGLAVVRQIVHAHGGNINYQTSQMNGAQFTIALPTLAINNG
jgi:signal transduction histidine kinase